MTKPMCNYRQLRTFSMDVVKPTPQKELLDAFTVTPVRKELMELAAKHTNTDISVIEREGKEVLEIHALPTTDLRPFYDEFERLEDLITKPLNEPELPDDHPVHQGCLYVVDNDRVVQFIDGMNMTVGRWKQLDIKDVRKVTIVKRCDIVGRQLRLPLKKEPETVFKGGWDEAGRSMKQQSRKPRSSNKIKKVK